MLNEIKIHLQPTFKPNRIITRYTIQGFPGLAIISKLLIPFIIRRLRPDNLTVTAKYIIYKIPPIISKYKVDIHPITITIKRR